jgi:zinc/manganese transport system substrate-binding protein
MARLLPARHGSPMLACLAVLLAWTVSGCADSASSDDQGGGTVSVVASTNVWGDIAQTVGGDQVKVTSIIDDPAQDPHSFEASSSTLLAITKADLLIENGGGYDDFVDTMVKSSDFDGVTINAVDVSGHEAPAGGELNEHVWYDLPTAVKVADQIASELAQIDPAHASDFQERANAFAGGVDDLVAQTEQLQTTVGGKAIGITEPVPLYLTEACGLVNATPSEFSEAVEAGEDVPVDVLQQTLDLFQQHTVAALVYNEQTSGPVTEEVKKAAEDAGTPVVPVTETLPKELTYLTWMKQNLDHLEQALVTP